MISTTVRSKHPSPAAATLLWMQRGSAALLLAWLALVISASPSRAELSAADINGVESGQLLFKAEDGAFSPALMQSTEVHFQVTGLIATVEVKQSFKNTSDAWVEGVYAFPLPDQAAVRAMEMRIGDRRIVGEIKEKQQAKKIYQQAVRAGKKASLVEQQRPNLFTNRVANIAPGETVEVQLQYVETVTYDSGSFSLRFPTTITQRYMPGQELAPASKADAAFEQGAANIELDPYLGWAKATDQVPDANAISPLLTPEPGNDNKPINPIEITAVLDVGVELGHVESAYHQIALQREAQRYKVRLARGVSEMDRDFELSWRPVTGAAPQAAFFSEQVAGEHYGLLLMMPPAAQPASQLLARELIFVIDTSGSMGGTSIEQARSALQAALGDLNPKDYFNVIAFESSYHMLHSQAVPASASNVTAAQRFVSQLQAGGGTEMAGALRAAMPVTIDSSRLRQIVFITDGAVGNEEALFKQIQNNLGDNRLYTVGIGSAPNSWFMRKAADFGRGSALHIGNLDEVATKMRDLLARISTPAVVDIAVKWPGSVEAWPERTPDLYAGEPVMVAVNFGSHYPAGDVELSGRVGDTPWQRKLTLPPLKAVANSAHTGIASVWASRKIEALLDTRTLGADEQSVRGEVLELALTHSLLSPYTSFVAVEQKVSRPGRESMARKPVPNTQPKGQSPQTYAYPKGSTSAPLNTWLGCLLLFCAIVVYAVTRPEQEAPCVTAL